MSVLSKIHFYSYALFFPSDKIHFDWWARHTFSGKLCLWGEKIWEFMYGRLFVFKNVFAYVWCVCCFFCLFTFLTLYRINHNKYFSLCQFLSCWKYAIPFFMHFCKFLFVLMHLLVCFIICNNVKFRSTTEIIFNCPLCDLNHLVNNPDLMSYHLPNYNSFG